MPLTLLVDLDDTLLANDMETFVPAYLKALAAHMACHAAPEQFISTLLAATRQMTLNTRPDRSLQETFEAAFYPALGLTRDAVRASIDDFYARVFPALQSVTRPRPGARTFIEQALRRGYSIAVATNPLFPRTAIEQRLGWAGISLDEHPVHLVTSYETFHFSKPNLAYYAEILGRLGWPEGPVVMVGDDLQLDITPARQLGLAAFWIANGKPPPPESRLSPNASGALADIYPWLDAALPAEIQPDYDNPQAMLATLRATPAALSGLTAALSVAEWQRLPQPTEWNLTEIVCHLRDVEAEVNLPRLQIALRESNPFLVGQDTDRWAQERGYLQQDGRQALESFTAQRIQLLAQLDGLQPDDWERPVRHAIFGPTHLKEIVSIMARHDRLHLRQIHALL